MCGVLDSISSNIAVLDSRGEIVAVNQAWQNFTRVNSGSDKLISRTGIGSNYLAICEKSASLGCSDGEKVFRGIRDVLQSRIDRFELEYPCHSPMEQRWFTLSVTPLDHTNRGVVISHTNITARKVAEQTNQRSREMLRLVLDNIPQGVFGKIGIPGIWVAIR